MTPAAPDIRPRLFRFLLRALLVAWAGFWAWFVLAVSFGETPRPPWWIPVAWLAGLAALVGLAWKRPRLGGLVLLGAGAWAAFAFPHPGARALLALPALALGLACIASGWRARRVAGAALVALALGLTGGLTGCFTPQDPADLPYRTSSILRHEDGRLKRAYLVAETELGGYPCRGYVWWHEDGSLDSLELAHDREVQGHAFPARTRVFFDREGRLAHAWLSRDTVVDGLPCRGRWKIDTAFHPNGRVKAFFPPETYVLDGVPCTASVFAPVYLYPDGRLRQCKLAADVMVAGVAHERGEILRLPAADTR